MTKCHYCKNTLIREYDEDGIPINFWTNTNEDVYCDNCFWALYTVPEEKAINNYNHDNKKVRERARKKIQELEAFWGIKS